MRGAEGVDEAFDVLLAPSLLGALRAPVQPAVAAVQVEVVAEHRAGHGEGLPHPRESHVVAALLLPQPRLVRPQVRHQLLRLVRQCDAAERACRRAACRQELDGREAEVERQLAEEGARGAVLFKRDAAAAQPIERAERL